jgi:transmembrane sensor
MLIAKEAAQWFVRLRDDNLGLDEQFRYVCWLKQSPVHKAEMLRICQLAGRLRSVKLERFISHQGRTSNENH